MENILQLIVLAVLVEAVWETLKLTYDKDKLNISSIGALSTGLVMAFATGADLVRAVGFEVYIPYVGVFATGILISRGGNFIHELIKRLRLQNEVVKHEG